MAVELTDDGRMEVYQCSVDADGNDQDIVEILCDNNSQNVTIMADAVRGAQVDPVNTRLQAQNFTGLPIFPEGFTPPVCD